MGDDRILCLAGWWPGENDVAGIFILEHIKAIAAQRRVVVVYVELHKTNAQWPKTKVTVASEHGLVVYRIVITTPIRRFGVAGLLTRRAYSHVLAKAHREDPFALVHIHVRTEATEQALPFASAHHLPVVLTEHNSFYHLGIRSLSPAQEPNARRAIRTWLASPSIAAVMPVSRDLGRVLHDDFGVGEELITIIPNVAADVFRPRPTPRSDRPRLLLAAVWRAPKDHAVFIEALGQLPKELVAKWHIDWAGYGPNYALIQQQCRRKLAHVDIRFPGRMDKPTLAHYMQHADLFVLPTTADNLPCVVLESLCCGTPVVSMDVNGLPELIDAENGLLVPPRDPVALGNALIHFFTHREQFDRQHIATRAVQRFCASAVSELIINVYRSVLPINVDRLPPAESQFNVQRDPLTDL